jgi:hypothetical protein
MKYLIGSIPEKWFKQKKCREIEKVIFLKDQDEVSTTEKYHWCRRQDTLFDIATKPSREEKYTSCKEKQTDCDDPKQRRHYLKCKKAIKNSSNCGHTCEKKRIFLIGRVYPHPQTHEEKETHHDHRTIVHKTPKKWPRKVKKHRPRTSQNTVGKMPQKEWDMWLESSSCKHFREKYIERGEEKKEYKKYHRESESKWRYKTHDEREESDDKDIDSGDMCRERDVSIEEEDHRDTECREEEIDECQHLDSKCTKEHRCHDNSWKEGTYEERMRAEKDEDIWIFGIYEEINAVYSAREKKDAIIKKMEVWWYTESLWDTQGYTDKCCIKENTRTHIDGLLESGTFWSFEDEESGFFEDIERGDNLWDDGKKYHHYHTHLDIAMKKEKNTYKHGMYYGHEKYHVKIIPSRLELQETHW